MKLNERQLAFLRALDENDTGYGLGAGRVFVLAFPDVPYRGRRDAGATRTLDALLTLGLVRGVYAYSYATGRDWKITDEGRAALRAAS